MRTRMRAYAGAPRTFATVQSVQGTDPILTNLATSYDQRGAYVADQLMPFLPVNFLAGRYYTLDPNQDRFRLVPTLRAPRTKSRLVEWATSVATYALDEYALAAAVDDLERDNAPAPLQPETEAIETATEGILLGREDEVATIATASATYPAGNVLTLSGTAQWSDPASNPISDVQTIKEAIRAATGKRANTIVIPSSVMAKLRLHQKMIDRMGVNGLRVLTQDIMSAIFEMPNVLIADAIKNTSNLGQAFASSDIWGKHVVIAYVEPRPGFKRLSFGYIFRMGGWRTRRWREEWEHSDYFEAGEIRKAAVVASSAGGVIRTAIP